jgi:hypothetical protein
VSNYKLTDILNALTQLFVHRVSWNFSPQTQVELQSLNDVVKTYVVPWFYVMSAESRKS